MKRIIFYILTALLLTVTFTACGTLPHEATDSPKLESVQAPTELPDTSRQDGVRAQQQARRLLDEQDYAGAIDFIREKNNTGLDEHVLSESYLQAAHGSLQQAEALMQQGHYSRAALLFKAVRDSYPRSLELQQRVTASPEQLTDKIDFCTEKLMGEGLVAYRSGAFATAIDFWQQVLKLDPQHQAAQSSIQTTQLQLANLKTLNSKD